LSRCRPQKEARQRYWEGQISLMPALSGHDGRQRHAILLVAYSAPRSTVANPVPIVEDTQQKNGSAS
jgi:hypothetical protein